MFKKHFRQNFSSIVWWSVIAAAFIGPGTVTTAAKAGADYGMSLIWTLIFATLACFVLQEAAARLRIISQKNLGESISCIFRNPVFKYLAALSVVFGCMAYETGNIIGTVEGIKMVWPGNQFLFISPIFLVAFIILYQGNIRWITMALGIMVGLMGICFFYTVFKMNIAAHIKWSEAFHFNIPSGSTMLILGLIGTTIVPYNLFLGSGMAKENYIPNMRFGLFISILIGGLITMAILITGSFISGEFTFQNLKESIGQTSGPVVSNFIGIGLFCAGLSSAITAPLAAAFTLQSINPSGKKSWQSKGTYFRTAWILVLFIGFLFSLLDFKPIPVIITAQILNGLILPFIAITIFLAINSARCSKGVKNGTMNNILLLLVILTCLVLGIKSLWTIFF